MDLRVSFDTTTLTGDLAFVAGELQDENGLYTAVVLSVFTDARLPDDVALPLGETSRRGVFFDGLDGDADDRFGSLLWTLQGEKQTETTRLRAIGYVRDALAWMVTDGVARQIDVEAEWLRDGVLGLAVAIWRPAGEAERFALYWRDMAGGA